MFWRALKLGVLGPQFAPWAPSSTDVSLSRKGTHIVLWTEDQELELQRLFEEFQDSDGEWKLREPWR